MQSIILWRVNDRDPSARAELLGSVDQAETEEKLERLLLSNPGLLSDGLVLVGRQNPTAGGPLDLLGVDADGRLVVFELKRGVLTRDAVAQVLDYVSDLDELDAEGRAQHVQDYSGRCDVEKIDDFRAWYDEHFSAGNDAFMQTPRAVLVGLGADDRARRMVDFLATRGIDISLLTFHGFRAGGDLLLARHVDVVPATRSGATGRTYTKAENQRILNETSAKHGCTALLEEAREAIAGALPGSYVWPSATCYGIYLPDLTETGKISNRSYLSVYVDTKRTGMIVLYWPERALRHAAEAVAEAAEALGLDPPAPGVTYSATLSTETWRTSAPKWIAAAKAAWAGCEKAKKQSKATPAEE